MATAFERDYAGSSPPWGVYPVEVSDWAKELLARPANAEWDQSMLLHPGDGRRWLGYKVGTYLVDRAMKSSGKSSAELASTPTDDVIEMALKD